MNACVSYHGSITWFYLEVDFIWQVNLNGVVECDVPLEDIAILMLRV